MSFQPAASLRSRTFLGLLLAQFLAAFNDQAIHASAMFFAIHQEYLTEAKAISLMPILFYAPWALFATISGYLADRYSKRDSLVAWKWAEVAIAGITLFGFWLGHESDRFGPTAHWLGPAVVLFTVFLMGTHSAFFVPAKYGVMPEILQPHLLSRGNGVLESSSFLAVILGTVSGGILSFYYHGQEVWIGVIVLTLAIIGAFASLLIERMPPANPTRKFPSDPISPLLHSVRGLLRSRPLALAVVGIAFFTFIVAYMRQTVYMLGESHNPKWTEFQTSLLVGTVALGIGLGSPLAGYFSGGKVELGLVPVGALGMMAATFLAAFTLNWVPGLVACIILIGFFTGFYIVPQYTLLQHRAPKTSKGDSIAASNFINVTGAILASVLFGALVLGAQAFGFAPEIRQEAAWAHGLLHRLDDDGHGRPRRFVVVDFDGRVIAERGLSRRAGAALEMDAGPGLLPGDDHPEGTKVPVIDALGGVHAEVRMGAPVGISSLIGLLASPHGQGVPMAPVGRIISELPMPGSPPGSRVIISRYELRGVEHFRIRPADAPLSPVFDNEGLPRYLFIGASLFTLLTLVALCLQLPDLFVRSLVWLRSQGRYRLQVRGVASLPSDGPVILVTNCRNFDDCMNVVASTDRYTRFVLLENDAASRAGPFLRWLARKTGLIVVPRGADEAAWTMVLARASRSLKAGNMIGLTGLDGPTTPEQARFLDRLRSEVAALVLPAHCTPAFLDGEDRQSVAPRARVTFGTPLKVDVPVEEIVAAIAALGNGADESFSEGH